MDYSIIDKLYEIYTNENMIDTEAIFSSNFKRAGFQEVLEQYIQEQSKKISPYYISKIDEKSKVDNIIKETTLAFETFVAPIQSFLLEYIYKGTRKKVFRKNAKFHRDLKPHDLFTMDIKLMEDAVNANVSFYAETFKQVKELILYVKENKLLQELFKDNSWHEMNFSDVIANIYDKAKDKSAFKVQYDGIYDTEETLFDKVKANCKKISAIKFDKYSARLNTSKQLRAEYGKLIFCKNLIEFNKTGIMPASDGFIDCSIGFYETLQMKDEFKELYSRRFNEEDFRNGQSNFICKPQIITDTNKLESSRKVKIGDRMIMGFIITASSSLFGSDGGYQIPYLLHINIEDVNNSCSNYEIQLNLLPQGVIANRLQLVRLDNWDRQQPHKNIANKLKTTTHIHLYNEFDLLRGKENGSLDIAYNIESKSTDFETSLDIFLNVLGLEEELKKKIYRMSVKAINDAKTSSTSLEI